MPCEMCLMSVDAGVYTMLCSVVASAICVFMVCTIALQMCSALPVIVTDQLHAWHCALQGGVYGTPLCYTGEWCMCM